MTIRETTAIQKKNHRFSIIKHPRYYFWVGFIFLLVFSNQLSAQQEGVIISSDFESNNTVVDKAIDVPTNEQTPQNEKPLEVKKEVNTEKQQPLPLKQTLPLEAEKTAQVNTAVELLPLATNKGFAELEQKLTTQQNQLEQLTRRIFELGEQNQVLANKFLTLQEKIETQRAATPLAQTNQLVNRHLKLKTQVINLAIQTSLLKPETVTVKTKKNTTNKDSAWYEKLIVVKKIEQKQESQQGKPTLYTVLKQFDLLQLALDTSNQQQWQTTLQSITTSLQSQYPTNAQEVVQQLKELQTQNIANSAQTDNSQTVDAKFGIK